MDGLLGGNQLGTLGLLGLDPEEINRARGQAQSDMYFALASQLLSGGPTGASIAKGLQMGQKAYRDALSEQTAERLQQVKIQDYLRQQQEAQAAKARQAQVDRIIGGAYQPATTEYQRMTPQQLERAAEPGFVVPQTTTPARFDLSSAAPLLMALPEGRKALTDIIGAQKAMSGELTTLAPDATLIRTNPLTGETSTVATGVPRPEAVPTSMREFLSAQQNPAYAKFLAESKAAQAPKIAVDLKDPTAVAKAQKDIVGDWRGVVKDTGAMEVADRFKAAKELVAQGNAGVKAADGALIYAIGKMYDPSGAVQEGDKATILGNRSIPDSIKSYAQKIFSGQDLLPSERQGLLSAATKVVEAKARNLEAQKAPYSSLSRQLGGTGDLLINPLADVLNVAPAGDLASQARAELERRRKGQ